MRTLSDVEKEPLPTTQSERVLRLLRADILSGDLAPGEPLRFGMLCKRYDVSVGVAREVLTHLAALGFVVAEPQHGFKVVSVTVDDLTDLTIARCEVECAALALSIKHGDVAWESKVVASSHSLQRTPHLDSGEGGDGWKANMRWIAAHNEFHASLLAACPSKRLTAAAATMRDAAEIYRSRSAELDRSSRDYDGEHRRLSDAVLDRDIAAATSLLRTHLETTAERLVAQLSAPVER